MKIFIVLAETLLIQTSACILSLPIFAWFSHSACLSTRATLHFVYTHRYFRFFNSNLINLSALMWLIECLGGESNVKDGGKYWGVRRWSDSESLAFLQWKCLTHLDAPWVLWEKSSPVSNSQKALWTSYNSVFMFCPLLVHCFFINTISLEDVSEKANIGLH